MALRLLVVLLVISLSVPATSSSASKCSDGDTAFLDPLVSSLIQWIADNSRYELVDHFVPRIEFVPNEEVDRLANPGRTVDYWQDVDACFITEHVNIYLSEDFDWRNLLHRSTLIHELVHFLQLINGAFDYAECPASLERPAYFLQVDYLDQHGFDWPEGLREHLRLAGYVIGRCPPRHLF